MSVYNFENFCPDQNVVLCIECFKILFILNNLFDKPFFYFYSIILCEISFQREILRSLNYQIST